MGKRSSKLGVAHPIKSLAGSWVRVECLYWRIQRHAEVSTRVEHLPARARIAQAAQIVVNALFVQARGTHGVIAAWAITAKFFFVVHGGSLDL